MWLRLRPLHPDGGSVDRREAKRRETGLHHRYHAVRTSDYLWTSADDGAAGGITSPALKMRALPSVASTPTATQRVVTVAHDGRTNELELIKNGGVWRFTPGAALADR